jgi:tetratricopeptide (TPR) repeat protein
MSASGRSLQGACAALAVLFALPIAAPAAGQTAAAQEGDSPIREAAKHFQHGVTLYGEADYRGALAEFKRAYGLAPNAAVLYNIGETEYQLQDYAAALTTFRRFLAESSVSDTHRAEVESNVEVLRARVGHLTITTYPPGADVTVDDRPVGKTPLEDAVLVSVGHRKVVAAMAERPPITRYVDVAAEDNVPVTLTLAGPAAESAVANAESAQRSSPSDVPPTSSAGVSTLRIAGWIATAAFAGGAATFAVLANKEAADLSHARNMFPARAAELNHDANLTTTHSILADSLTAAAVVVGGITLFSTLSSSSSNSSRRGNAGHTRVVLGPASARLQTTF